MFLFLEYAKLFLNSICLLRLSNAQASLMNTIINLAQNFVGSNNLNVLQPIGQFGTRLHGGKDAASPRYIFTSLRSVQRFNKKAKIKCTFSILFVWILLAC